MDRFTITRFKEPASIREYFLKVVLRTKKDNMLSIILIWAEYTPCRMIIILIAYIWNPNNTGLLFFPCSKLIREVQTYVHTLHTFKQFLFSFIIYNKIDLRIILHNFFQEHQITLLPKFYAAKTTHFRVIGGLLGFSCTKC